MPARLPPLWDLVSGKPEEQAAAVGAVLAGNLMTLALLRARAELKRHPEKAGTTPRYLDAFPRLSWAIFLATSVYFLALARQDAARSPERNTKAALWANRLGLAAVLLRGRGVFTAQPLSEVTLESLEQG